MVHADRPIADQMLGRLGHSFHKSIQVQSEHCTYPDQLKGLRKKGNESFKEYAQRCRAIAVRFVPLMLEQEVCFYIIHTLDDPFFRNMLGPMPRSFLT